MDQKEALVTGMIAGALLGHKDVVIPALVGSDDEVTLYVTVGNTRFKVTVEEDL